MRRFFKNCMLTEKGLRMTTDNDLYIVGSKLYRILEKPTGNEKEKIKVQFLHRIHDSKIKKDRRKNNAVI